MKKKRNYWNKENTYVEALKYGTRKEFHKGSPTAYEFLRKKGCLDDACIHMGKPYNSKFKWTLEKCREKALKYNHRKEFQVGDKNAYQAAKYNGWLDDVCVHMNLKKLPNRYWWSFENCKKEALKYKTKTDFVKNSQHVYSISVKNGWLDDISSHMVIIGDRYNKCVYAHEFPDNHVYVGLTYNIDVREKSRRKNKKDSVTIYRKISGLESKLIKLTEYIPVDDAVRLENEFLKQYVKDGWIPLNRRKTGGIGSCSAVWNLNRVRKIAQKYKNIDDFKKSESELYEISKRSGWLEIFNYVEI